MISNVVLRYLSLLLSTLALAACAGAPARGGSGASHHAAEYALEMVGKPYRYGGFSPAGFDCSGLVHYSFGRAGVRLPRDTPGLRRIGDDLDRDELAKGDLVFFDQEGKKASHVGIYLGDGRFVHAPSTGGRVRIDRIDSPYWRKHFNEARRI
jgi:cell wall-associated NlpC family hydrolase